MTHPQARHSSEEGSYAALPELAEFAEVCDRRRFSDVPDSWHIVITDVVGSTAAVEPGGDRDVNALGVASIIAIRNALPDLEVPFLFGGDGATLLPSTAATSLSTLTRVSYESTADLGPNPDVRPENAEEQDRGSMWG